ncbi:MAG: hypothetical protein MZV70_74735 [Desulfobacterales bacterium]|nr:hypothetical protein [Desulfobacterales bacterium]
MSHTAAASWAAHAEFPDGTCVGVNGLEEIMAELYAEGKKATKETAEEAINRLEAKNELYPVVLHCPQRVCLRPA